MEARRAGDLHMLADNLRAVPWRTNMSLLPGRLRIELTLSRMIKGRMAHRAPNTPNQIDSLAAVCSAYAE